MLTQEQQVDRIVSQEVIYCVSMMVHEITSTPEAMATLGIDFEDAMEILSKPDYDEAPNGYHIVHLVESDLWGWDTGANVNSNVYNGEEFDTEQDAIKAAWEDSGDEPNQTEALEHWIVSDWLADKLEQHGEMVARDFLGLTIWGRTTSGQHIGMDSVIEKIAKEIANI